MWAACAKVHGSGKHYTIFKNNATNILQSGEINLLRINLALFAGRDPGSPKEFYNPPQIGLEQVQKARRCVTNSPPRFV